MPRYRASDPGEELGAGIESLGSSIAGLITARKQYAAQQDAAAQDSKLWDALVQPDESGKMVGERLSEAPNKPLAVLKWMQDIGVKPSPERLTQLLTMVTPPAGDGPHVQALPAEDYFKRMGLSTPEALKGAIVKLDTKSGNADFLYKPEAPKEQGAPTQRVIDLPGGQQKRQEWVGGQWQDVGGPIERWQPQQPQSEYGMSAPVTRTVKGRDPVTGATIERTETLEFVPKKGGGGFMSAVPGPAVTESSEPMAKAEAGSVQGAREGIKIVGELRGLLFKGGKLNTGALASKAMGLPGAVAPEGASIEPKILQAIDPYVRLTTGAALNEQELKNAHTMFVPSVTDGDKLVKDKLDRLERFLSGDLSLMGMVAQPGSQVSSWVGSQSGGAAQPKAAAVPTISTKEQYDKLKSGEAFIWNGRRGVKP